MKRSPLALAVMLSASLSGCPKPSVPRPQARADAGATAARADASNDPCATLEAAERDAVIARVGETTLTTCDFVRRLATQNPYLRARMGTPEARRGLVRAWVDSELLAAEARARGLDREPAVRNAILSQLARQVESELRQAVPAPTVTDADIAQYFQSHRDEYETPEQVKASHIVLATRADADRVLAEARRAPLDEAGWRALVQRETRDLPTREVGGDLGFFAREGRSGVSATLAAAAFRMRTTGEVLGEVVEVGPEGGAHTFHVLRLTARREALHRTLEEVRRPIRNRLYEERLEAAQTAAVRAVIDRLRTETPVQIDQAALSQVRLELPAAGTAPAMPGLPPSQGMLPAGVQLPAAGALPR